MSALPRPNVTGPGRDLNDALHDLHHRAGWPSLRTLARETGVSHTTVSKVFSQSSLPGWGNLELLVEAMGGDVDEMRQLWLAASAPREATTPSAPRIAGRRSELAAVRRHLETGTGLLLVTGEAGIGKTKLVTTAADSTDGFVAVGHCLPLSTDVPLLPVADLLQRVYEVDRGAWLEEALTDCPAYARGSIARLLPDVASASTDPDDEAPQRLLLALRALIGALGSHRPLALVLEDLHWADASTLDALEHMLARGVAVALVGTWRTDDDNTAASLQAWRARVGRLPSTTELRLQQLTRDETGDQMALSTGHVPDPDLVDRVHARSQGHPLFTDQLTAHATDDGTLPSALEELLEQRIAGMSETASTTARVLAVATRPLDWTVLEEATGLTAETLTAGLHELRDRRLLAAPSGPHGITLRHPLLAEAVVNGLVGGQAVDAHRRLAHVLSRSADPEPAEVAIHWECAGDPEQELAWRVRAAQSAESHFAHRQAADQWSRALALWPEGIVEVGDPPVRLCEVHVGVIQALGSAGDSAQAAEVATEALETIDQLGAEDAARLLRLAADCAFLVAGPEPALELLDRAIALHETLPTSADYARALERRAGQLRGLGRYAESAASVAAAVAVAEGLDDPKLLRGMVAILAWHEHMAGHAGTARTLAGQALEISVLEPDPRGDIWTAVCITDLLLWAGATGEEIEEAGRRGLRAIDDWDVAAYSSALLLSNVAQGLTRSGRVQRAAELIAPHTTGRVTPDSWPVHVDQARVDILRGDLRAASRRAEQLKPEDVQHLANRSELVLSLGELYLWDDRPGVQLSRAVSLLETTAHTETSEFTGMLFVQAARCAADQSLRPADAAATAERLRSLHASVVRDPFAPSAVPADRSAAAAAWAAELARLSRTETVELWATAAAEWERLTRPFDAAYCRWRAAQCALRDGQGTLARRLLSRAAADAREHVPLSRAIAASAAGARA